MSESRRQSKADFGSNAFRKQMIRNIVEDCGLDLDKDEEVVIDAPIEIDQISLDPAMVGDGLHIDDGGLPEESILDLGLSDFVDADLGGQDLTSHGGGDGQSVKAKLFRTAQLAQSLSDKLNDEDELPPWIIGKAATVLDRVEAMFDFLDYKMRVEESRKTPPLSNILFEQEEKKEEEEDDDTSKKAAKEELLNFANKGLQEVPNNQVDALMDQFKGLVDMAIDKKLAAKEEKLEKKMDQESGAK